MTEAAIGIYAALSAAQAEIKNPEKTKTADAGKYKYKYADIADVLESCLPTLTKHNLSVLQMPEIDGGNVVLRTRLSHISGEFVDCFYPVCATNGDHQRMGAALTYARRYALCSLIGIAAAEDVDAKDAATAGEGERKRMSSHEAKNEIDWPKIEANIRAGKTMKFIENWRVKLADKKSIWPPSYISQAHEEVNKREAEIIYEEDVKNAFNDYDSMMAFLNKCRTPNDIDTFKDVCKALNLDTVDFETEITTRLAEIHG